MRTQSQLLRWQEMIWLLIAFLTPLWINLWVEQQFEASKVWLLRTLVFILVALGIATWQARQNRLPQTVILQTLTLACVIILSTVFSQNRYIALYGSLERTAGAVTQLCYLLLFLMVGAQLTRESRERLLRVIVWTGVPIGLFGLAQIAGWQPLSLWTDARTGIATTLGRSNFTAAYLALLIPLTLATLLERISRLERWLYGGLLGIEIGVIIGTQARAGVIALIVAITVFGWLQLRRWRVAAAFSGLIVFAGSLVFLLQRGIAGGGSIAARWTIWGASLGLLWRSPWLGYGADTLELIFPAVYPPQLVYYQGRDVVVDRAHNWLLDYSLSYGIVATGLLIALVGSILWRQRNTQNRWLQACIAGVCAQLVGNLFLFEVVATGTLFWLLLATLLADLSRTDVSEFSNPGTRNPIIESETWRYWVVGVGIVVTLGLAWVVSGMPLLADAASWRGTQALGRGDVGMAVVAYERATTRQPQRAAYWVALGLVEMERGEFVSAETHLQTAESLRPTDPQISLHLATLYTHWALTTDSSQLANANTAYQRSISQAPNIATFHQQYADFALRTGDFGLAIAAAEQAVALDATNGLAFGVLGWARLETGDLMGAEEAFLAAVEWSQSADFYLGLATVYYQQNNFFAAQVAVGQSLRLDPNNESAVQLQLQFDND